MVLNIICYLDSTLRTGGVGVKPTGFWSIDKYANTKQFLESFASSHDKDPLIPDTWYSLAAELMKQKVWSWIATNSNAFAGVKSNISQIRRVHKGSSTYLSQHWTARKQISCFTAYVKFLYWYPLIHGCGRSILDEFTNKAEFLLAICRAARFWSACASKLVQAAHIFIAAI